MHARNLLPSDQTCRGIIPDEINSIDDHDKLMNYMTRLSFAPNKIVVLTPENQADIVLISVDKDEIKISL
jgi:hypothetical protein